MKIAQVMAISALTSIAGCITHPPRVNTQVVKQHHRFGGPLYVVKNAGGTPVGVLNVYMSGNSDKEGNITLVERASMEFISPEKTLDDLLYLKNVQKGNERVDLDTDASVQNTWYLASGASFVTHTRVVDEDGDGKPEDKATTKLEVVSYNTSRRNTSDSPTHSNSYVVRHGDLAYQISTSFQLVEKNSAVHTTFDIREADTENITYQGDYTYVPVLNIFEGPEIVNNRAAGHHIISGGIRDAKLSHDLYRRRFNKRRNRRLTREARRK